MTISRHLEIIICSAKSKSPARNLCQEKELQNRGVEDGFNALSQRHSWRPFHPLSAAGHPFWRQHGGKPAEYAPEPEDNASYLERTMRR